MELAHGFIAGVGQSVIAHPIDTYKTWLQVQRKEPITLKGLYRGFAYPTLFNSLISGVAFKAYEMGKNSDSKYGGLIGGIYSGIVTGLLSTWVEYKKISAQLACSNKFNFECVGTMLLREIPACVCYYPVYDYLKDNKFSTLMAGGIAGVTCWTSSYWADVLNTRVMAGESFRTLILTLGPKDYFRGIFVCVPRAFIINATGYYFYEMSKTHLC
jgi:hypothetical protein